MTETKILQPTKEAMTEAKNAILKSEIVGIPTETVYGLGANAFDEIAIKKIFEAKGRPQDNPLIVHIGALEEIDAVVREFSDTARKLAEAFWPGPLTMVLPKSSRIPDAVSAGLDTVGVRMPSHTVARGFISACGVPIAAPSANVSGKPSPTSAEHVYQDLKGRIGIILDGGECEVGLESTVIRVSDDKAEILRPGKITVDNLLKVVSTVQIDDGVFTQLGKDDVVASPGMKYKHYSPNADVTMVEGKLTEFSQYVMKHADEKTGVLVFEGEESLFSIPCITYGKKDDSEQQANRLFDALREIDGYQLNKVFARVPVKDGVGLAVYNRLLRACGFDVVSAQKETIIGLTGQTGSGKSTLCDTFAEHGVMIIPCDEVSRRVIAKPEIIQRLSQYFGEQIFNPDGTLNRRKLAVLAFSDEENHIYLNNLMYPEITKEIKREIKALKNKGYSMIMLDAPTLFESGAYQTCDTVISVIAPADIRKKRIMERDNLSSSEAEIRMNAQHDNEFYCSKSQYIIENTGSLDELKKKAVEVIDEIQQKAKKTT